MITTLAQCIAGCLLRNGIIDGEKLDIYIYGFEIIISNTCGFLIAFILGLFFSQMVECAVFMLVFVILRSFCGGYHADTYLKCNTIFATTLTFVMIYVKYIPYHSAKMGIVMGIFSLLTIILFSPVENKFKPLDEPTKRKCKIMSLCLACIVLLLSILLRITTAKLCVVIDITLLIVAVSMIIEIIAPPIKS